MKTHPLDILADPTRRSILEILCAAPQPAGDLARLAGVSQSAASQHLKLMMQAGLVDVTRAGKQRIYRCLSAGLGLLQSYVAQLQSTLSGGSDRPVAINKAMATSTPAEDGQLDVVDLAAAAYGRAWPGQDPHIYAIAIRLLMLASHVQRGVQDTAARLNLHGGELMVLDALLQQGPPYASTPTELKKRMPITLAGISKRIDRLQEQGLVVRMIDPEDGRSTLVRLTAKAHGRLAGIMSQQQYGDDHMAIMRMDAAQRALLSGLLKKLLGMMDEVNRERSSNKAAGTDI